MVQHRNDLFPRPVDPQGVPTPLVLYNGDTLWKCWVTNVHRGVRVQVLSARRAEGTFSTCIVFIYHKDGKKPTVRFWVKHQQKEEAVVDTANEIMKAVSSKDMSFRLIDLSESKTVDDQLSMLRNEGYEIVFTYAPGVQPVEGN